MNDAFKYIYNKFFPNGNFWFPFITNYYLTYDCNFNCFYCSDGYGKPYHSHANERPLTPHKAIEAMKKIAGYTQYAMITGGEPLLFQGFDYFIQESGKLKFKNLALTTNAFHLENYIDLISKSVDTLIISLDTLNETKSDLYWGNGSGSFKKVLQNIELGIQKTKNTRAKILISSVICPDNIQDQYEVYDFAKRIGAEYAGNPQLIGVRPEERLINNQDYNDLFDFLIEEKRNGGKVFGYNRYLIELKELNAFQCYPFAMLGVAPNGDIFYPCYEIGDKCANIFQIDSLHHARKLGKTHFGSRFKCDPQCHSVCALLFSLILRK